MGQKSKLELRKRRKKRIRTRVSGSPDRPRLAVYRSLSHIYAQVIDDRANTILASASSLGKAQAEVLKSLNKTEAAKKVGTKLAELCKQKGIERVVFDRNGYRYHGRVRALASSAREGGLQF